jgi:hypothetical protein
MKTTSAFYSLALAATVLLFPPPVQAGSNNLLRSLSDALVCKGKPATVIQDLVTQGSDFKRGYATFSFGEGTSHKAIVILQKPLFLVGAKASAVVSESESSHFDFSAFIYARFEGDYLKAVRDLHLIQTEPFGETSLGRFVSQQHSAGQCLPTITLTPISDKQFLLGCGWCNG